jgi:hypothetical protein
MWAHDRVARTRRPVSGADAGCQAGPDWRRDGAGNWSVPAEISVSRDGLGLGGVPYVLASLTNPTLFGVGGADESLIHAV